MNITYISHHKRPCYEYDWFSRIKKHKIQFIDTNFSSYPKNKNENIFYNKVDFQENKIINKFLHSSASFVKYENFEKYLKDTNLIISLEVFSTLSRQFVEYAKENNKKSVVLVYELIPNHPIYKLPIYKNNTNYVIKNADFIIAISKKAKDHLIKIGTNKDKIKVIYPGIDLEKFHKSSKVNRECFNIIFTGKLELHKGIDDLLSVFQKLSEKYKKIKLTICGEGSYKQTILDLAKKYQINYLGKVDNDLISKYLSKADVFVFPARDTYKFKQKIGSEQFGFSVVEAMACGLPIVAYDCGAISEIIGKENFAVTQNDQDGLYEIISKLYENKNLREKISINNLSRVNMLFNINNQSEKLIKLFESLND